MLMILRCFAAACFALAATVSSARAATAGFPGPQPGRPTLTCADNLVTVSNKSISISWQVTPSGLRPKSVTDVQERFTLVLTGEVFEIRLPEGRGYPASRLRPKSKPHITRLVPYPKAARLAARIPGRQVELQLQSEDEQFSVTWRAILHENANYVRQEIDVTCTRDCTITEISWLNGAPSDARRAGTVEGSPIVARDFFFGIEDPHSLPDGVALVLRRNAPLAHGAVLSQSFVTGVAPPGQMRRAFLYYLERERAHPFRPFLHYNSWYDIAWQPFALNEPNCLEAITLWGDRFIKPYGVKLDALVFDDGWDDPTTLWHFHGGFPNGFTPLARRCAEYGTRLGVWLSPFGGYGEPREKRLRFGASQGLETNATGFSLAGPKYYAAFKEACTQMIRKYRVNHFKFDGIGKGMYASGGAEYVVDTEAMRRLMLELRQEDPDLYINLTTGSWPSPFWLRYADSLWRQGGDMGYAGKGSKQQQWLTYRDQEVFRNVVGKGPLFPLNALMTQGVAYSRQGSAGEPTFNSAGFKDDVRAFFGGGTGLQELYVQPGKLTPADWQVLAEAARWSRANADTLVDTHWVGGDPGRGEVYGYASWTPHKAILMLRNPDERPQEFVLNVRTAFELPPGAKGEFRLKSPWTEDAVRPLVEAKAGKLVTLALKPFEVVVLESAQR
jgi:hypothetical protein